MAERKFTDLFAFDLDGTLVHPSDSGERTIPQPLLEAVHELATRAHIMIATGRRFRSAKAILKTLPMMPYSVFHNGLVIKDEVGVTVEKKEMNRDEAVKIANLLTKLDTKYLFVCDDLDIDFIFLKNSIEKSPAIRMTYERWKESSIVIDEVEELIELKRGAIVEVAVLDTYINLRALQQTLLRKLHPPFGAVVVKNIGTEGYAALEIFSTECSKWTGIQSVKLRLGAERVIAVGDDENDLEMIKSANIGIVMSHAEPHIREVSSIHIDGHQELTKYLKGFYSI